MWQMIIVLLSTDPIPDARVPVTREISIPYSSEATCNNALRSIYAGDAVHPPAGIESPQWEFLLAGCEPVAAIS